LSVLEGEETNKEAERMFEEIMIDTFPNLMSGKNLQIKKPKQKATV
jgi:hypothetical protein